METPVLQHKMTRRSFARGAGAALVGCRIASTTTTVHAVDSSHALVDALARIETQSHGRLGVAILDTQTGAQIGHRAAERFPICSTFKLLLVGAVLARIDSGRARLQHRIQFSARDLVAYSPTTQDHVGGDGMSLAELCEAAITLSDNTAANLLLAMLGGPDAVTQYARSLGDAITRLDRIEPALNEALPGDPRDTSTPQAMLENMRALTLGRALSVSSRAQLIAWLVANKTGGSRLRAGLPKSWRIGDKTGSGANGSTNDVAILWPRDRKPVIVSVYLTGTTDTADQCNATLAAIGRALAEDLTHAAHG
jgi:beta-lactamase class A